MDKEDKQRNSTPYKKPTKKAQQSSFLAAYEECGNITAAAKMANMDRKNHYMWVKDDESYIERFESAHQVYVDGMEAEARRRAVEGVDIPIFYMGKKIGNKKIFSDTLLIFLLKGELPDKYKERAEQEMKHTGQLKGLDLSHLSFDELKELVRIEIDEEKD